MVRLNVALNPGSSRGTADLLDALRFLITNTRLQPGCVECSAWADADSMVHYVETWETEPDMRRRVRSPQFTSLLAVVESLREPPLLQFDFVTSSRGLDYVAEARGEPLDGTGTINASHKRE
jgi:quinol monooxygenase YgiN